MKWLLLLALGATGALIVTLCLAVLLVQHRLRRRNRVRPTEPDDIPFWWLVSPQPAPRLHRRLVVAAQVARMVADRHRPVGRRSRRQEPPTIVGLCAQLVSHAASIDYHLPLVAHLPAARRRPVLTHLAHGVAEIERTATRLSVMSAEILAPTVLAEHVNGIAEMTERLDALESAGAILRDIETGAGVTSRTPFEVDAERVPLEARPAERRAGDR